MESRTCPARFAPFFDAPRLDHLGKLEDAPQFVGSRRDTNREQGVTGFSRSDQMTHRADSAYASHQGRRLGEGAAFAEFLKSTKLGNVETCILLAALVVQVQRDLGMSLDASYGIDQNRLAGLLLPRG
jgi:hypothetical protein